MEEDYEARTIVSSDPFVYLEKLLRGIEKLYNQHAQASGKAGARLAGIGTSLAGQLLPAALRDRLAALHRPLALSAPEDEPVPTLYLLSEASWIPWELVRLPPGGDDGEGPFLAEAFALTRWLLDPAPAASLPLAAIALVLEAVRRTRLGLAAILFT